MNTMCTSILERSKEIGIMKSVGAKNSDIFSLFLIESGILGTFGGVIGIILGYALAKLVQVIATQAFGEQILTPSFGLPLLIGALLFSFLVGALSGVFPAMNASKKQPVDTLRYE